MNAKEIDEEYRKSGRISGSAMSSLRAMLRDGDDPYLAITLAGDVAAFQLAEDIALHLSSDDPMVRWNAAGVLFTRFRDVRFAQSCLDMLNRESDTIVRAVTLAGAGELLPFVEEGKLQKQLATRLLEISEAVGELPEIRAAAYLGIEAAVGLSLAERSPADRLLVPEMDFKDQILTEFRGKYRV